MTSKVRITKSFAIEMAHALWAYDGACKNIHGHTYYFSVTVIGNIRCDAAHPKNGMVMDFFELKKIVQHEIIHTFDHALVLNENMNQKLLTGLKENFEKIIFTSYQPTCENLLLEFKNRITKHLPPDVHLHHARLKETATSSAEWYLSDN